MLFSTDTGEPLAIFPDGYVRRLRVAGASAIAARYEARTDSSSWLCWEQAGSQRPPGTLCMVIDLREVTPIWDLPTLSELVNGQRPGRVDEAAIGWFCNNAGLGLQFAAVGAEVLARAPEAGVGREIPTDWFLEDVHP